MPPRKSIAKQVQTPVTDRRTRSHGAAQVDPSDYSAVDRPRASGRIPTTGSTAQANNGAATTTAPTTSLAAAATTTPAHATLGTISEVNSPGNNNASTSNPSSNSNAATSQPQIQPSEAGPTHNVPNNHNPSQLSRRGQQHFAQTPTPMQAPSQQSSRGPSNGDFHPQVQAPSAYGTVVPASGSGHTLIGPNASRHSQTYRASASASASPHQSSSALAASSAPTVSAGNIRTSASRPNSGSSSSSRSFHSAPSLQGHRPSVPLPGSPRRPNHNAASNHGDGDNDNNNNNDQNDDDLGDGPSHNPTNSSGGSPGSPDGSSNDSFTTAFENQPPVRRSVSFAEFCMQYWEQVKNGFRYFENYYRLPVIMVVALEILRREVCSAGDICEQNSSAFILLRAFQNAFWTCFGLWVSLFLCLTGIVDLSLGVCTTIYAFLHRHKRRRPVFPILFHSCVVPILILLVMLSLPQWKKGLPIGDCPRSIQLVCANVVAHLFKWLFETVCILYGTFNTPTIRTQCFLVTLSVLLWIVAITVGRYQLHFDDHWTAALRYWNGDRECQEGRQISVHSLMSYPVQSMSRILTQVTHETITQWVQPTTNVQGQ